MGTLLLLSACLPEPATPLPPTATLSATPSVMPSPTITVMWFPATITPTPLPTREPEPVEDMHPALGAVILSDDFSGSDLWQTTRTAVGSMAYGQNDLTLAVSEPRGTLMSLRSQPQLSNFYLEVDADPSLCRGEDMYGLLLRAELGQDFYRLLVNCDGELRVERVKDGRVLPLQDWTASGQVFAGFMMKIRLGVWVAGNDLRVFVNDVYQFTVHDTVFPQGSLGVFARSAGETPLTVSFSNLSVREVDLKNIPTPVPTPTSTSRPTAVRMASPTPAP